MFSEDKNEQSSNRSAACGLFSLMLWKLISKVVYNASGPLKRLVNVVSSCKAFSVNSLKKLANDMPRLDMYTPA